jgi:hypothetical protein
MTATPAFTPAQARSAGLADLPNEIIAHILTVPAAYHAPSDGYLTSRSSTPQMDGPSLIHLLQAATPRQFSNLAPPKPMSLLHRLMDHCSLLRPEVISTQISALINKTMASQAPLTLNEVLALPPWFARAQTVSLQLPEIADLGKDADLTYLLKRLDWREVKRIELVNAHFAFPFTHALYSALPGFAALETLDLHVNMYPFLDVIGVLPALRHAVVRFTDDGPSDQDLEPNIKANGLRYFVQKMSFWPASSLSLYIDEPRLWHDDILTALVGCVQPILHSLTALTCIDSPVWNDKLIMLKPLPSTRALGYMLLCDTEMLDDNMPRTEIADMVANIKHHQQARELILTHTFVYADHFPILTESLRINSHLEALTLVMKPTGPNLPITCSAVTSLFAALLQSDAHRTFFLRLQICENEAGIMDLEAIKNLDGAVRASIDAMGAKHLGCHIMPNYVMSS